MEQRHCGRCRVNLPLEAFYPRGDGYINFVCIECIREREKAYREKMNESLEWRVKRSEYSKAYYRRKKLANTNV